MVIIQTKKYFKFTFDYGSTLCKKFKIFNLFKKFLIFSYSQDNKFNIDIKEKLLKNIILTGSTNICLLNGNSLKPWRNFMDLTLSIIKPDAAKRSLIGNINSLIEKNNMKIVGQKMLKLSIEDAQNFYIVHKEEHF